MRRKQISRVYTYKMGKCGVLKKSEIHIKKRFEMLIFGLSDKSQL